MIIAQSNIGHGVSVEQISDDKYVVKYGCQEESFDNLEEALTMGFSSCVIHAMEAEGFTEGAYTEIW